MIHLEVTVGIAPTRCLLVLASACWETTEEVLHAFEGSHTLRYTPARGSVSSVAMKSAFASYMCISKVDDYFSYPPPLFPQSSYISLPSVYRHIPMTCPMRQTLLTAVCSSGCRSLQSAVFLPSPHDIILQSHPGPLSSTYISIMSYHTHHHHHHQAIPVTRTIHLPLLNTHPRYHYHPQPLARFVVYCH